MSQSMESKLEKICEGRGAQNKLRILRLILENGPIDRKDLVTRSELPIYTVQDVLNTLLADNLVQKARQRAHGVHGRPREVFETMPQQKAEEQAVHDAQLKAIESRSQYRRLSHAPNRPLTPPRKPLNPAGGVDSYQFVCRRCLQVYAAEVHQAPRERVCLHCKT